MKQYINIRRTILSVIYIIISVTQVIYGSAPANIKQEYSLELGSPRFLDEEFQSEFSKSNYIHSILSKRSEINGNSNSGDKIIDAGGLKFKIPSYASGINEIKRPSLSLLPPVDNNVLNIQSTTKIFSELATDLLPPLEERFSKYFTTSNSNFDVTFTTEKYDSSVTIQPEARIETSIALDVKTNKQDLVADLVNPIKNVDDEFVTQNSQADIDTTKNMLVFLTISEAPKIEIPNLKLRPPKIAEPINFNEKNENNLEGSTIISETLETISTNSPIPIDDKQPDINLLPPILPSQSSKNITTNSLMISGTTESTNFNNNEHLSANPFLNIYKKGFEGPPGILNAYNKPIIAKTVDSHEQRTQNIFLEEHSRKHFEFFKSPLRTLQHNDYVS